MRNIIFTVLLIGGCFIGSIAQSGRIDTLPINQAKDAGFNTQKYKAYKYTRTLAGGAVQVLPYRMIWPVNYKQNPTAKYPLLIMLHGAGERGTDNNFHLKWGGEGHQQAVLNAANPAYTDSAQRFDGFVMFPQTPYNGWANSSEYSSTQLTAPLSQVHDVIDSLIKKYRIDPDRIVIHGLSSGGSGTWASLYHRPDLFAAGLPMSAPGDVTQMARLATTPIWLSQGGIDDNPIPYISHQVMQALRNAGAVDTSITRYSEYPGLGHVCWQLTYDNRDFFPYILRFRKTNIKILARQPKCPGEFSKLGVNPTFFQYQWYKNGSVMPGETSNILSNVADGTYYVKFKRNAGDALFITSNSVVVSTDIAAAKPVISASQSLILPSPSATNVTLTPQGTYANYEWSNGATTKQITTSLSGSYSLRVKEATGCWSQRSDTAFVKSGSMSAPVPGNPGGLKAVPLSQTSIKLSWNDITNTNETGYEIYRSTQSNSGYSFLGLQPANTLNFIDVGLTPSTRYYYKIRSVTKTGAGLSPAVYAETFKDAQLPSIPQKLAVLKMNASGLTLIWNKSTDQFAVKRYLIYSNTTLLGESKDTTFLFAGMGIGQSYMFSVEAEDYSGNKSGKSNILPLVLTGNGLFSAFYQRKVSTDDWYNLPVFSQLIPDKEVIQLTPAVATNGTAPNLLNNNASYIPGDFYALQYTGFIKMPKTAKWKIYSRSDEGITVRLNNAAVPQINENHLTGNPSSTPNSPVQYSFTFDAVANVWYPITISYFERTNEQLLELSWEQINGPTPLQAKQVIGSTNFSLKGQVSTAVSSTGPNVSNYIGMVPSTVASTDKIKLSINITFNSAPTSSVKGFDIYRKLGADVEANYKKIYSIPRTGNSAIINFIDSIGLIQNTQYQYYIAILSETGSTSYHLSSSPTPPAGTGANRDVKITTLNTTFSIPTPAPTLVSATGISNSTVRLTFSNTATGISGFEIYKSQNDLNYALVATVPANKTSFDDNSGIFNTIYYYKIKSYNQSFSSGYSNMLFDTTLNIPDAPTQLKVQTLGPKHVNLNWINNSLSSGYGIAIYRSTNKITYTRIDSIMNPGLSYYQDTSIALTQKVYYKVRAFNDRVSAFSNVDSSVIFLGTDPTLSAGGLTSWKMPVSNVVCGFKNTYGSTGRYVAFNNNILKLKTDLEAKEDFKRYLYIQKNDTAYFSLKLPIASEMPYGGMITLNISTTEDQNDYPDPDSTTIVDESFVDPGNGTPLNYPLVKVYTSVDGVTYSLWITQPASTMFSNDLNKIDIPADKAGLYIKISVRSISNSSDKSVFPYRGGLLVSEIGAYRFLGTNIRHNYFLICGASVEKLHPYYMGLTQFRKQLATMPDLSAYGKDALIFNISKPARPSSYLRDSIQSYLNLHPRASYVIVHQGGNDINDAYNNMRPLTYSKLQTLPNAKNFIDNFTSIINTIQRSGKLALISRMHFRSYKEFCAAESIVPGAGPDNAPGVARGRKQENGSLPLNLLLDSLTKLYTPYAYNFEEKRSNINFYPVTLNSQEILGGDGIHPNSQISRPSYSNYRVDSITNYWINYTMRYVYTGKFAKPKDYTPGGIFNPLDPNSTECGLALPANKPNLLNLTIAAVNLAEKTKSGNDIWEARILVEQLANKATRLPYVNRLDSLNDYRSPANPTYLSSIVVDGTTLQLSWLDNAINETGYQIWKSIDSGQTYKLALTLPADTGQVNITGLSGDTTYYFYVRAVHGNFKSGWSNIVNGRPGATYYSNAAGNLSNLAIWGKNPDGTGSNPSNFTTGSQVYVISNRPNMITLTSPWNVSGRFSKVTLSNGTKLTAENSFTGDVEMMANTQLILKTSTIPNFVSIDSTSSISFLSDASLTNSSYGKLQLTTAGVKTFTKDTVVIKGDLLLGANITVQGRPTVIKLDGDLIMSDSLPVLNGISLILNKKIHSIDAKGGSVTLKSLASSDFSSVFIKNGSKLKLGNVSGGGYLPDTNSTLYLDNGEMHILGSGALNPLNKKDAKIASTNASLNFNTTSSSNSYLNPADFNCSFKNITYYSSGGALLLQDSLELTNTLKLSRGNFNTGNHLVLTSNVFGTARIAKVESNANLIGQVTWQRTVGPFKTESYYHLGTPIKLKTLAEFKEYISVKGLVPGEVATVTSWNETTNKWVSIKDPAAIFQPGTGYRVFIDSLDITHADNSAFYQFKGEPFIGNGTGNNTGSFSIPLTKNMNGFNLISNPYPCEIDWKSTALLKNNVRDCYYVWDGSRKSYKVYCSPGGGAGEVSTVGMTSIINSGQGFLVKATGFPSSVTFTEDVKRSDTISPVFYRKAGPESNIRINFRNEKYDADEALIRFFEESSVAYDPLYDALKNTGSGLNMATMAGSDKLTINTLPYAQQNMIVPLHVQSTAKGQYYLDFTETESFDPQIEIYLYDKELGSLTDLRKQYTYAFNQNAAFDTKTRFDILFKNIPYNVVLANDENPNVVQTVNVYPNPAHHKTTFSVQLKKDADIILSVYDTKGQIVYNLQDHGYAGNNSIEWDLNQHNVSKGLYYFKLKVDGTEHAGKLVVQ